MRERGSQARRRRLIQGGLLQEQAEIDNAELDAHDESSVDAEELAVNQAMTAVLDGVSHRVMPGSLRSDEQPLKYEAGLAAIQSLVRGQRGVTWVFAGDNIVQGAYATEGARSCVEIFTEGIRARLNRVSDVVINTGIAGDTAAHCFSTIVPRILRFQPDIVGLSLGLNDAKAGVAGRDAFRRQIRAILDRIRTAGGIPLVILPHPVYGPAATNRGDLPQYVEVLRDECQRDEVPLVDQWTDWLQRWPDLEQTKARLADGRMQLNAAAHRHLAKLMFHSLELRDTTV